MVEIHVENLERQKLAEIEFFEVCCSIKEVRGFPGDLSDVEYAQQVRIRDLLAKMIEVGFQKVRARELIAEASDTPAHIVRQWTRHITKK